MGVLDSRGLPVIGRAQAIATQDETRPRNVLIPGWEAPPAPSARSYQLAPVGVAGF